MNCRSSEYYTVCDISMCCSVDLPMYSNVYEGCVVNPNRDKCWIVLQLGLCGLLAQASD